MKGQQPAWGWNTVALAAHDTCKTEANRGWYLQDCSGTTSLTGRCSSTSRPRSPARPWTPHRCRPAWPQPLGSPHPGKSPPRTPTRPPEAPKAPKTPLTGPHLCRPPPPPRPPCPRYHCMPGEDLGAGHYPPGKSDKLDPRGGVQSWWGCEVLLLHQKILTLKFHSCHCLSTVGA